MKVLVSTDLLPDKAFILRVWSTWPRVRSTVRVPVVVEKSYGVASVLLDKSRKGPSF